VERIELNSLVFESLVMKVYGLSISVTFLLLLASKTCFQRTFINPQGSLPEATAILPVLIITNGKLLLNKQIN
jgi:hypothetical protein